VFCSGFLAEQREFQPAFNILHICVVATCWHRSFFLISEVLFGGPGPFRNNFGTCGSICLRRAFLEPFPRKNPLVWLIFFSASGPFCHRRHSASSGSRYVRRFRPSFSPTTSRGTLSFTFILPWAVCRGSTCLACSAPAAFHFFLNAFF